MRKRPLSFACGHTEAQEHALVLQFIDGLREYIKHESRGKFNGKYLAPNWGELSEKEQDHLISDAFVRDVFLVTSAAHKAIHEKETAQ